MKVKRYVQQQDGDKIVVGGGISGRLHKLSCCDCGLTHVFKFRLEGSEITFRVRRDNRATGQRRRYHDYPKR